MVLLVPVPKPCYAQSPEEEKLYEENFGDNQAQGWNLTDGWTVSKGVLIGRDHNWAWYTGGEWEDFRLRLRLWLGEEGSVIHLNYRLSMNGTYYIGFHDGGVYLSKEGRWRKWDERLGNSSVSHSYRIWYNVEIVEEGGHIRVIVNGTQELTYEDPEPLRRGTIAFETLMGSYVKVDDIVVIGLRRPREGPDLVVLSAENWDISDDGRILELFVEIVNQGNIKASETLVHVKDPDHDWVVSDHVPALDPNERTTVKVQLEIPKELRGAFCIFIVEVDPEDQIEELDDENNIRNTPNIRMPGLTPPPHWWEQPIVVVSIGVAATTVIMFGIYGYQRRRRLRGVPEGPRYRALPIDPSPPPKERIVSTGFSSQTQAGEPLDSFVPLAPGRFYYFWFEVGSPVPGSIEVKPEPLMIEFLPSEARLKVVLFAFEGEIEITSGGDVGEIQIMPDGKVRVVRQVERPNSVPSSSDLLDRRLFFLVHTPNKEGVFHLRCNVYYEQNLIRSRLIQVCVASKPVRSDTLALQSTIEYTMSKTLNPNYFVRMKPQKLSVMLNNSNGTHCLRLFGEQDYKGDSCFDAQDLETLVKHVRGALRRASWGDEEPWTEAKSYRYEDIYNLNQLKNDLINFAIRGYRFWSKLTVQLAGSRPEVEKLESMLRKPTTLEFAIRDKTEVSHLFPPAMIYDYPLDTNLNREAYTLCPSFLEALESGEPLEETSCFEGDCPSRGNIAVICPSGFWGFRHSIGNPLGSRFETNHDMLYKQAPELTVAVYPSFRGWPSHRQTLKSLMPGMIWNLADTRPDTLAKLESTNPHIVYFYCHGGVTRDTPYIKVGAEDEMGITPDNLDSYGIYWKYPQPLIFINGCHTTASEPKLAMHFVEKFMITCNAAGVIGTEITIFEQLAGAFAEKCLHRFVVEGETIGDAVRGARLKLLKQGNPLGLVYNIFANVSLRLKKAAETENETQPT